MVSVIIPSRNEEFLQKTVNDLFAKARGDIEVIVVLDEQDQPLEPHDNLIVLKKNGTPGMKSAIMQGVAAASGQYIMKTDAHCMFGEGFDTVLANSCDYDWVVIPRRYSLDPYAWEIRKERPVIDYEFMNFPWVPILSVRRGGKWYERAQQRKDILIDETMTFQGSCYFLRKEYFLSLDGFMESPTGDDFLLDSEELSNKTWLSGGKVMVNKNTWYAHFHKGQHGRGYFINKWPMRKQREFHYDYWMHDRWPKAKFSMAWLVGKFMPIPGWPEDWQDPKYEAKYKEDNGL